MTWRQPWPRSLPSDGFGSRWSGTGDSGLGTREGRDHVAHGTKQENRRRPGDNSFLLIPCRSCSSSWLGRQPPKLRKKQENTRPGDNSFLLIPCRSCSSSWLGRQPPKLREKQEH